MQQTAHWRLFLFFGLAAMLPARGADDARIFSSSGAQAILDKNCVKCHGPLEHKSGLELDTVEGALKGNKEGPVLVPGKPAESKIIAVLSRDADPYMPPK